MKDFTRPAGHKDLFADGQRLPEYGRRFGAILAVALVVHYQMIANGLQNPDSIWLGGDYHIAGSWELSLGRWGLVLVDLLRGGFISPVLSGAGMLVLYTLAGLLLVPVLNAGQSRVLRWVIPLTVVLAPQVLITESYLFCSLAYALAFLLAVAAAGCIQKLPARWGWAAGALCLTGSVSLYQSNVGVTTGLLTFWLLASLLACPDDWVGFGRRVLRALLGCGAGLALYYLILQILLRVAGVSMASYKGAGSVGVLHSLANLTTGLPNAYRDFFAYFFGRSIAANHYGVRYAYGALFLVALLVLLVRLWKLRRHPAACALAVVLLVVWPAAVAVIDIIAPETTLILLTCSGLLTVVPVLLTVCMTWLPEGKPRRWTAWLVCCLAAVLLREYVLQVNTDSTALLASQRTTLTVAGNVLQDLQEQPAFQAGTPVTVLGRPEQGNYPNLSPCYEKADILIQMGLLFGSPHANSAGWQQIFRQYLGVAPAWCSQEEVLALVENPEYQEMPLYPQEGSIREIDGCLVVKIAP